MTWIGAFTLAIREESETNTLVSDTIVLFDVSRLEVNPHALVVYTNNNEAAMHNDIAPIDCRTTLPIDLEPNMIHGVQMFSRML